MQLVTQGERHPDTDDSNERLIREWLEYLEADELKAANTVASYEDGIRCFKRWLESSGNGPRVGPRTITAFRNYLVNERGVTPATSNLRLAAVRGFYRWMVATERIPYSPASSVRGLKEPSGHRRERLTDMEMRNLLETCREDTLIDRRDAAILSSLAYGGLRVCEVSRASMGDFRREMGRLVLRLWGKGKAGPEDDAIYIVPEHEEDVMFAWLDYRNGAPDEAAVFISLSRRNFGDRLAPASVEYIVKDRMKQAGIYRPGLSAHCLRHTAISNAILRGKSRRAVQRFARHKSATTTDVYIHELTRVLDPVEDVIEY